MLPCFEIIVLRTPLFLGAIWVLIAFVEALRVLSFQKTGLVTQGTVIRLDSLNEGCMPIVEYKDQNGSRHELKVDTIIAGQDWIVGSLWPVRFHPTKPTTAKIDQPAQQWRKVAMYVAIGFGLSLVGVVANVTSWFFLRVTCA